MRKKLTVLIAVLGLLAISGIALAAGDDDDGDTVFNYGYDVEAGVLVWNTSPTDGLYDCSLEDGPLNTTYTRVPDGTVLVDELSDLEDSSVMFAPRPQEELAPELEEADAPVAYEGSDGPCGLSGGSVAGPNGQINHGMFMKLFNSAFDWSAFAGTGRGCINRHLAQSDLGKWDQQVKVSEVDPEASTDEITEGVIEFSTVMTDCLHNDHEDKVTGQEKAAEKRADHAGATGAASGGHGKSASAPGHNKDN